MSIVIQREIQQKRKKILNETPDYKDKMMQDNNKINFLKQPL